jgi:RNA polymerase sigma-70 factor (ECF subfamily)
MPDPTLQLLLDRRAGFLAFVRRQVGDRELAEDILQAAYLRALEKSSALRAEDSAVAWFYSVLRHAVVDHYRRHATESSAKSRFAAEFGTSEPSTPAEETRTFVCGCIEHVLPTLRPSYAEVIREVDLAEMPLTAYAEAHKLTPGNAAVRAHRARAALKRELARTCGACSVHACLDCCCKQPARAPAQDIGY